MIMNEIIINKSDKDKLLNPKEVSQLLGITEDTLAVWRCNKTYNLPYINQNKKETLKFKIVSLF